MSTPHKKNCLKCNEPIVLTLGPGQQPVYMHTDNDGTRYAQCRLFATSPDADLGVFDLPEAWPDIEPHTWRYYDRTTLESAFQAMRETIDEWEWAEDKHGYCHFRPDHAAVLLEIAGTRRGAMKLRAWLTDQMEYARLTGDKNPTNSGSWSYWQGYQQGLADVTPQLY